MPRQSGIPPGRAGRQWLVRRIATAERGREQLDRKLRVLRPEQQRFQLLADREREAWRASATEADTWLLRAGLLGGQDVLRWARPHEPLAAFVGWRVSMGLRYPVDVTLAGGSDGGADGDVPGVRANAAVGPAVAAVREAVAAAVRLAAAQEAQRRLDAEVQVTRRRLRALEKRLLPRLREQLRMVDLDLEQAEQEDAVRVRLASRGGR